MKRFDLSLYLVLDPGLCAGIGMIETARRAVQGGVTMVQLRDKHAGTAALVETGRALQQVLKPRGALLIINDDVEAALLLGADGVHIGQEDMDAGAVRRLIGPDMILGLSVETEALAATVDPAVTDYAGIGPVFATPTKPDHKPQIGIAGLSRLVSVCAVPSVAIGGLKAAHIPDVITAGAHGIAVVSAICGTADPFASARSLSRALAEART
ncbi:thiamine phosphate synthase [Pararhizobium sp.]|uniref:thiamine phosphate synthase n=1 Tax=Pararhizobium sp. TaxID=1977563 RepID=UPI0027284CF1|nr:thiamine phosphate synthase [Pararhizobium sp.]MDO9415858.1 thiamine phosphate synthase [Pararhizobium sp.]